MSDNDNLLFLPPTVSDRTSQRGFFFNVAHFDKCMLVNNMYFKKKTKELVNMVSIVQ